jgi:hypothetical protein
MVRRSTALTFVVLATATATTTGVANSSPELAPPAPQASVSQGQGAGQAQRVLLTDRDDPIAKVVDLRTDRVIGQFPLTGTHLTFAHHGEDFGYVVQGDFGLTSVVDAAPRVPTMIGTSVRGSTPIHFVANDGRVAIFNDGTGVADVLLEETLDRRNPRTWRFETARPHHGVAVPTKKRVITSAPNPGDDADRLPVGVDVRRYDGSIAQRFRDCPRLHGEAESGTTIAFGCVDGAIVLTWNGNRYAKAKLDNPTGAPAGRIGLLDGQDGVPFFIGNFGNRNLSKVDPAAGAISVHPLDGLIIGDDEGFEVGVLHNFDLLKDGSGRFVVLTTNGQLHLFDGSTMTLVRSVQVVAPFLNDGPRPRLGVGDRVAVVTDPRDGRITEVAVPSLRVDNRIRVGGAPYTVAVLD